ncbi:MAG: helix-turn-helix domain-containing protein [Gammaproteobacteria bacterium]|nr:helix-turn-helix domain-containing protein [Gammaproteobacteria bacterium]
MRYLALLGDTHEPIQRIASQTGYQSSSACTRAFQDKFGMAPKEYRRTHI